MMLETDRHERIASAAGGNEAIALIEKEEWVGKRTATALLSGTTRRRHPSPSRRSQLPPSAR
jgi:hypothetical protein